jgi:starch phosphorylase
MEYGLDASLPIYSGGLGVLAGDTMKSVSDLRMPVVGIGILWSEGYTVQRIGAAGRPVDSYPNTPREHLIPVDVEVEVPIAGKLVSCRAFRVEHYLSGELYLLEPVAAADRWITRRLYGGGAEDRLAQELILGVGGVRLLDALGIEADVLHFNEGHAVFAGLELVRRARVAGASLSEAMEQVRQRVVFTTHTPVAAGNEIHPLPLMRRMGADCGLSDESLTRIGGAPFSMTEAGLRLSRAANAVAELHGETSREMWKHVEDGAPIRAITNGVHVPTWQDARIRAANAPDKPVEVREAELWRAHQVLKGELLEAITQRTGQHLSLDRPLIGFARRAAPYKRADLIFSNPERLMSLFAEYGLQLVFAGKAHPRDTHGKQLVTRLVSAARRWPDNVVFLESYDMELGALLTRGVDVWLNNPRRPMEASGTSGMKAAMNGVPNASILDGWWPEGCRHGETGWQIGDPHAGSDSVEAQDAADAEALYGVLECEILPLYRDNPARWAAMMRCSIEMSQWRFSSDRMLEDYFRLLYRHS